MAGRDTMSFLRTGPGVTGAGARSAGSRAVERMPAAEPDPALGPFLDLVAADIKTNPERLVAVDEGLLDRLNQAVGGVKVDLDAPLRPEDE